jgi:hypothetical protein
MARFCSACARVGRHTALWQSMYGGRGCGEDYLSQSSLGGRVNILSDNQPVASFSPEVLF